MCDIDDEDITEWLRAEEERQLTPQGIREQNAMLLSRYRGFRRAADVIVDNWRTFPQVEAVSLIGSLARDPWEEVPRFAPYRRAGIRLWHECRDLDLAVWLSRLEGLGSLRRVAARAVGTLLLREHAGVSSHQIDAFILEPDSDRYLGRLCIFNACPKHKPECRVPGCGVVKFLRQFERFTWRPESLQGAVRLFDRATGTCLKAVDLSLPEGLTAQEIP